MALEVPPQLRNANGSWFSIAYRFFVQLVAALATRPRTVIVRSSYAAAPGDVVFCDTTAGSFTVTLPGAASSQSVTVFKASGDGHAVNLANVDPLSGPTSITAPGGSVTSYGNGSTAWVWA